MNSFQPGLADWSSNLSTQQYDLGLQLDLQQALMRFNRERLQPAPPVTSENWHATRARIHQLEALEFDFLESERRKIATEAALAPTDPEGFVAWYEALESEGPGQHDCLFDWLANEASRTEMAWFIGQELVGEAGFDDLLSLTMLGMPAAIKLEMARNFWDEMGKGTLAGMHGPMLGQVAKELEDDYRGIETAWQALALANLMAGLAANRHYTYHSIGCLGAVELTAPGRCVKVTQGLQRVGLSREATRYYRLHGSIDVRHSAEWVEGVVKPLVKRNPECARHIAEGALMRLNAGARNYDYYRQHFNLIAPTAHRDSSTQLN